MIRLREIAICIAAILIALWIVKGSRADAAAFALAAPEDEIVDEPEQRRAV